MTWQNGRIKPLVLTSTLPVRWELTGGKIQIIWTLLLMMSETALKLVWSYMCKPGNTHADRAEWNNVMSWCFLIVSFQSMCQAARWSLGLRRKSGDICVGNASGCCSFPFPFFSHWQRCAENNNRKMVLAPKWNLQRGASCLLAGAGSFALEEQIQTWNTLFAHWTGSNKATAVTSLFLK